MICGARADSPIGGNVHSGCYRGTLVSSIPTPRGADHCGPIASIANTIGRSSTADDTLSCNRDHDAGCSCRADTNRTVGGSSATGTEHAVGCCRRVCTENTVGCHATTGTQHHVGGGCRNRTDRTRGASCTPNRGFQGQHNTIGDSSRNI